MSERFSSSVPPVLLYDTFLEKDVHIVGLINAMCSRLDYCQEMIQKHLPALERAGETKPWRCLGCGKDLANPGEKCDCQSKPSPTPATVEKFNSYKFDKHGFEGGANFYLKVFVGEVVATPYGGDDERWKWQVKFPGNALVFICYTEEQWRALVDMMLANKYWERQS